MTEDEPAPDSWVDHTVVTGLRQRELNNVGAPEKSRTADDIFSSDPPRRIRGRHIM